jgi:hypothetical protein
MAEEVQTDTAEMPKARSEDSGRYLASGPIREQPESTA